MSQPILTQNEFHVKNIAIVGSGTMGQGIAQVFATAGSNVHLYDVDSKRVEKAIEQIRTQLNRSVAKGTITVDAMNEIMARVVPKTDLPNAVHTCDCVLEAAPENLDVKINLFQTAIQHAPSHAILASNTSSLSITELGTRIQAPERTIGLHFFNPPPVMELLEIVRGYSTSEPTIQWAYSMASYIKKTPILVNDSPGFATSRLGVIIAAEAMRMLETGVASVADIDRAMELGYRHPMGPLKLTDLVGLDVRLAILEHLHKEIGPQFSPPPILRKLVRAGHLGKKTGRGFYVWAADGPQPT